MSKNLVCDYCGKTELIDASYTSSPPEGWRSVTIHHPKMNRYFDYCSARCEILAAAVAFPNGASAIHDAIDSIQSMKPRLVEAASDDPHDKLVS